MILRRCERTLLTVLTGALVIATSAASHAQDTFVSATAPQHWAALTEVFQGDAKHPAETHQIAFQNGIYYDFPTAEGQPWTIFDLPQSRVILLDRERQQRTSIPTDDLVRLTARAQSEITDAEQRARFGMDAQPIQSGETQFSLRYDDTEYHITGVRADDTDVAAQYGRFVDWVCRLNIARPKGVPPFARMKLNALMTQQNVLPRETTVTITRHLGTDRTAATIRLRSLTSVHGEIDDSLAAQIHDAKSMRVVFKEVSWDHDEQ